MYQLSFPPLEAICYFGIVFEDSHFLVVSLFQFWPAMKSQMAVLPARRSVNLWLRGSQILSPVALEKERGFEAFEAYSDLASLWKEWGNHFRTEPNGSADWKQSALIQLPKRLVLVRCNRSWSWFILYKSMQSQVLRTLPKASNCQVEIIFQGYPKIVI